MGIDELPCSPACERNKEPILGVLREAFAASGRVLEIGSGTGQHAVHFARHLPQLSWQPTDRAEWLEALQRRRQIEGPANLLAPIQLDVNDEHWPAGPYDAAFSANTLHIMSWPEVELLFRRLGGVLGSQATLAVYGPFKRHGEFTSPSNAAFDADLRRRDPASGIRDREALQELAVAQGFAPFVAHALPANNELLVWKRSGGSS